MKKLISIFIGCLALVSCEDFLVENPKNEKSLDQFFESPEETRSLVNTLYRSGATGFYNTGGFRGSVAMMGGYMSGLFDNEAKGERIEPLRAQELTFTAKNMAEYLDDWWTRAYNAISTANTAIQYIPETEGLSETDAQQLLAQSRFFRAFNYFFLIKNFGDVPLITEPYNSLEGILVERTATETVYNQIVEDLNWVISQGNLATTPFSMNGFRITEGAAAALLADVHLQMAGYPVQDDASYADAAQAARMIINSGEYELIEHGSTLAESAYNVMRNSDMEREYIYSFEYDAEIDPNPAPGVSLPGDIRTPNLKYSRTLNAYRPLDEFVQLYETDKDLRIQNQQLFFNSIEVGGQNYDFGEYAPFLFYDETALYETGRGDQDVNIYRYAEILLIAAEAIARSEGVTPEAISYLSEVRSRAYWQTDESEIEANLSGLSVQAFVEEVWKERHRELALDYKVWSDIQRTRLYPVASQGNVDFVNVVGHTNPWGATYQEFHLLFPISDNELQRNPMLEQNTGY